MTRIHETIWCDGCGVEILWPALVVDNHDYCCQDCLEGYRCECGEHMVPVGFPLQDLPATPGIVGGDRIEVPGAR